jgi:hypothetical protein
LGRLSRQGDLRQPLDQRLLQALRLQAGLEADDHLIDIANQVPFALQGWLPDALQPQVPVHLELAPPHAEAPPWGYPWFAGLDDPVFQPPGFQPPPDQAQKGWVPDSVWHQAK